MNVPFEIRLGVASQRQVAEHLLACDQAFEPPLGDRVNIPLYAQKLIERAVRHEAWVAGDLVGLVATYCTDVESYMAYVTSVSVLPQWRNLGLAEQLLRASLENAKAVGMRGARLEVGVGNARALRLYEKLGFQIDQEVGSRVMMSVLFEWR